MAQTSKLPSLIIVANGLQEAQELAVTLRRFASFTVSVTEGEDLASCLREVHLDDGFMLAMPFGTPREMRRHIRETLTQHFARREEPFWMLLYLGFGSIDSSGSLDINDNTPIFTFGPKNFRVLQVANFATFVASVMRAASTRL